MISLCMIARNESDQIAEAIQSARSIVGEIIVVDNGSTDGTAAITEAAGGVVVKGDPDLNNKSAWRNQAADAASNDWVLVLDADERFDADAKELHELIKTLPDEVGSLSVKFVNESDSGPSLEWHQVRLYRKSMYRYKYREHEVPISLLDGKQAECDATIRHYPRPGTGKISAMLERLELDVEENQNDPHPRYFLGRQYCHAEKWAEASETLKTYLEIANEGNDRAEAYGLLSTCEENLGNPGAAVEWLHRALESQPLRRIWWLAMAELYERHGMPDVSVAYVQAGLHLRPGEEPHHYPWVDTALMNCWRRVQRFRGETWQQQQ